MENSSFSRNQATNDGGGIFNEAGGELHVVYSTFLGNIANPDADLDEGGHFEGGGLASLGTAKLSHSILSGSRPQDCFSANPLALTGQRNLSSSCYGTGKPGEDFSDAPVSGLLTVIRDENGVTGCIPCCGAATPSDLGSRSCLPVDQNGSTRPYDGDGDGVARCDIGAVELQVRSAPVDLDPVRF